MNYIKIITKNNYMLRGELRWNIIKISVKSKEYVVCLIILIYIAYLIMCVCTCALLKYFVFQNMYIYFLD